VRLRREQRRLVNDALESDELEALTRLSEKASAWLLVAGGAFLIAVADTWSLHEAYQWAEWAFWTLIVAMSVICATLTSYRTRRRRDRRRNAG
jgi:type VI protein secretion system component VasK